MPSFAKARASGKAGPGSLAADPVATLRRQGGAARAAQRGVIAPKTADRVLLAEREEPVQQTALVHHLDAAHVQAERADHPVGSASRAHGRRVAATRWPASCQSVRRRQRPRQS
jgi:hypothetical protein